MKRNSVRIICELEVADAAKLLLQCASEGTGVSEKLAGLMQNFLSEGDNHPRGRLSPRHSKKEGAVGSRQRLPHKHAAQGKNK